MRLARRRPPSRPDKWPNVDSPIRDWPLLQEPTFRGRLAEAVREGILLGVKLALAVGLVLLGVSYLLNDYNIVRQRALHGQQAFEFLQQQQQAARPPAAPTKPTP